MTLVVTFNGNNYNIPDVVGSDGWGPDLTNYLAALAAGAADKVVMRKGIRTVNAASVTVQAPTDFAIIVKRSPAGATTVNLPAGQNGMVYAIVDGTGDAALNTITIIPNGGQQINGTTSHFIQNNRGGVLIAWDGTEWFTLVDANHSLPATVRWGNNLFTRNGNHDLTINTPGATIASFPTGTVTLAGLGTTQTFTGSNTFSSPILASSGAAGAPSYTFSGNTNTGIFSNSSNIINFSTNGANRLGIENLRITNQVPFDPQLPDTGNIRTIIGPVTRTSNAGNPTTGTLKITLPVTWNSTFMRMKIKGYNYNPAPAAWEVIVSGYNFAGGPGWFATTAQITGNFPGGNTVRFAHDGTRNCILLGTLSSVWYYPSVSVEEVQIHLSGYSDGSWTNRDLWQSGFITSEAGITNIVNTGSALITTGNLVIGQQPNKATIQYTTNTARTYTIPDAGANASFVMTEGAKTINGTTTFGSTIVGSINGNANTATTLQTARTINGVSFNGSANITITANTPNTLTRGSFLTGANFNGSAATTWAVDADSANVASKVVARDGSGNFAAGTITAALSGNASTATTLQTSRNLWGNSFNGSADITGAIQAPVGSAASPSYTFSGNTNTGIFRPAVNEVAISTNGTEKFKVDSTGSITLGQVTNTPYTSFHTTYKNISSGTPSGVADSNGMFYINANNYSGAAGRQPTRLSGLTGARITLSPRTSNTATTYTLTTNIIENGATDTGLEVHAITALGAHTIGPTGFTGTHTVRGGWAGRTDASTYPAGAIGEVISDSSSANTPTSWTTRGSVTLTAGRWLIIGEYGPSEPNVTGNVRIVLTTVNNGSNDANSLAYDREDYANGELRIRARFTAYRSITATTTYYLSALATNGLTAGGSLTAIRIA